MTSSACSRSLGAALAFAFVAYACVVQAEPDVLKWLKRVQLATQKLSYSGTVVYQQGDRTETSRITHLADGDDEIEKIEFMDGMPREVVRTNDIVRCYLPERQTIRLERRSDQRSFPAVLPKDLSKLGENYDIAFGEDRRIAGFECKEVIFKPKDELRYGYRIWADRQSAMLLKSRTVDSRGATVEQFSFAQFMAGSVTRDQLKTRFSTGHWAIEDIMTVPANLAESGWSLPVVLPGFAKVLEVRRQLHDSPGVGQVVYSDGIAAVSIFIEPLRDRGKPPMAGLVRMGAINLYARQIGNHLVTAMGEIPPESVTRMAATVRYSQSR